jgi:pimeloyl-ACP methyl ester carboxylesterase
MKQNLRGFTGAGPSLLATFTAEAALAQTPGNILSFSALGQFVSPPPVEAREPRYLVWRGVARATVVIAGLLGFPALAPAAAPAAVSAAAPVPVLDWQPCPDSGQRGFDCATAHAPLDYSDPQGATIELAVIRHLATDPANRLGTLFVNPGGPGGPGTVQLPQYLGFFPATLSARFDLISWDPRGVGASTAVLCFATLEDEQKFFAGLPDGFPVGRAERRAWISLYARFGLRCAESNGDLLKHVSTTDTAKDLDLLRQAVGDPQLNFLGISYGTFLGAIYANLFPDKVRTMVLDGNLDPVAWTNGGDDDASVSLALRLGSDTASAKTLDAFLTLCGQAAISQCAFSAGSASATKAKWTILLRRLRENPVTVGSPPQTFTYAALVTYIGAETATGATPALALPLQTWTPAAELLQALWNASLEPSVLVSETATALATPPEWRLAVLCGESPNPRHPDAYPALAALAYAQAGDVGPAWVWGNDEPCAGWPATASDRYVGPWNQPTANPVLVIGNLFDPETPYEGSVAMAHELAHARLLTVDGYGHTALLNPSTCANDYVSRYVVDGTLPPPGTVCPQDQQPFTTGP